MQYSKQEILDHLIKLEEALLSGNYKPTTGALKRIAYDGTPLGFCCLGVACEISNLGEWQEPADHLQNYHINIEGVEEEDGALLPYGVDKYFGFEGFCRNIPFTIYAVDEETGETISSTHTATEINDSEEDPFPIIAKLLREQYIIPLKEEIANE